MNLLITGITGFFGRNFTKYLITNKVDCKIIGTSQSEYRLSYFKKSFPEIKTHMIELSSNQLSHEAC